ncbi:hypothetical protein SLE2022_053510 [Rubroshorea leprosula]
MAQVGSVSVDTTETLRQVLSLVEAFRAFDADNDGAITSAELGGILSSLGIAFEGFDLDGDESVTGEELFQVMANFGAEMLLEDALAVIASMDGDGDGAVSFEDFKHIINCVL